MNKKLLTILIIFTIMMSIFVGSASAQAYNAHFTTAITYVNVGTATTTTLDLLFYGSPDDTSPIVYSLPALAPNAASAIYIGNITDVPAGFQGDAIMQSDQPMMVTLVQIVTDNAALRNRALSNGFSAGAAQSLIGTVLKGSSDTNSIIAIQNADSVKNTVVVKFYDTAAVQQFEVTQDIESGASFYIDVGQLASFPANFSGSAVATATKTVGGGDGAIVSSVMELNIVGKGLKAFEGVASGAKLVYMPSALCNVFGGQNTAYAIQNADLVNDTTVTVTYSTSTGGTYTASADIGPGAKATFIACDKMPQNTFGSAVVESTVTDIIAIGKTFGAGMSSGFIGVSSGSVKNVLPYVRWATNANWFGLNKDKGQRVFLAIQNLGTDFAVGDVITVAYTKPDGSVAGTDTITVGDADCLHLLHGEKCTSDASKAGLTEFGYWPDGSFGGAAIVTGPTASQLATIARLNSLTSYPPAVYVAEDYNGQ
jgi:hypothetical protein